MMENDFVEYFGYLASLVIFISLSMSSIVKLRIINMIGGMMFVVYGNFIHSLPVSVLNFGIVLMNIYYLYKFYTNKEKFDVVKVQQDSDIYNFFLESNKDEIEKLLPLSEVKSCSSAVYLMRNNEIAGILVGNKDDDVLDIKLDYVIPKYRDYKIGRYFFIENPSIFRGMGIKQILAYAYEDTHVEYLKQMGFFHDSEIRYKKYI